MYMYVYTVYVYIYKYIYVCIMYTYNNRTLECKRKGYCSASSSLSHNECNYLLNIIIISR